jgi:hypothetical protein
MNHFKNDAEKGAFGEFVYENYINNHTDIYIESRRVCEHDFYLKNTAGEEFRVDVKTTIKNKTHYTGYRVSNDIQYDLVVIKNHSVYLIPDNNSPITSKEELIGNFESLYKDWQIRKKQRQKKIIKNESVFLKNLKFEIMQFGRDKGLKFRIIYRGPASNSRWGKRRPDNIIPSLEDNNKFDYTIFVQMKCENFVEVLQSLTLFKHRDFDKIPTHPSDKRQLKKGITKVIDLNEYESNQPKMLFDSLSGLFSFLNNE